jgi:methylenetetrahydrofolate dehydrogenase (NADP+) / methenyltetrahydrofolate cyclohydrolase
MTTRIFSGLDTARGMHRATRERAIAAGITPTCTVVLDADNPGASAYAARQQQMAGAAGITLRLVPYETEPAALYRQLAALSADAATDAVMALYPLPSGADSGLVASAIGAEKDVDGLHPQNAGTLLLGRPRRSAATAQASVICAELLYGDLSGARVAIIGASPLVGRPLAMLLLDRNASVMIVHAATRDLPGMVRQAELVISATGVAGLITADHIAQNAILIDVGISRRDGRIVGDVDLSSVAGKASVVTHAPDGVGPITTACLFDNILDAALARRAMPARQA